MRRLVSTAALAVCLLAAAVTAAGAQTPPVPIPIPVPVPVPPNGKLHLPHEKVETFKLVVDGTAHAGRQATISGQTGGCDASLNGNIEEDADFGRGKGLTMEFVRYKRHGHTRYGFQRAGRTLDSSFNVVAKIFRLATGTGALRQHPNSVPCPLQSFDLSDNASCGKTITDNEAWGLRVKGATFSPRPAGSRALTNEDRCGEPPPGSAFSDDLADLPDGWPTPPLLPFERIPLHKMFNRRFHAFKVVFKTPRQETKARWGAPPLQGSTDDHGSITATVRFIRK
jgi:hypothetical protein